MSEFWWWITLLVVLTSGWWYLTVPKGLPPGTAGLPIVGYLPFVDADTHLTFSRLGKRYGSVFYTYLGNRLVVVLNDFRAAKEALVKQAEIFAGRPADVMFKDVKDNLGLIATDGDYWKQHRRFILSNLREYGVGKLTLEPQLLNEIQHFLAELRNRDGKSLEIKNLLGYSLGNNIHILVSGDRYNYDHPMNTETHKIFKEFGKLARSTSLPMFFPWIVYVPGADFILKRKATMKMISRFLEIVEGIVKRTEKHHTEGEHGHYINDYLTERNARLKLGESDVFTDVGLIHNTRDLITAGTDTSSSTLLWAMLYMTNYPEVQRKVQKEIDEVIGMEREPSYNDRTQMPYTEATICEINRIVSHVPLAIAHRNTKETTLFGHRIPQNTMTFINIWNIHHDPELWGDPENFRPERFIDENGDLKKPDYLVPFSMGKRACVGEPLARMELFLYFVSFLQHFDFVPPNGIMPSLEGLPGFTRQPRSKVVCAKSRKA